MPAAAFTTKQYRYLITARWIQRELGCPGLDEATAAVRRALILQKGGVRRLLAELLGETAGESASGWTVEYDGNGRSEIVLQQGTLLEALTLLVEQRYIRSGEWPAGVRKGSVYVALG